MSGPDKYEAVLEGVTSILMHRDDVVSSGAIKTWREERKRDSKIEKGDDRYPSWTWKTYLYADDAGIISVPSDNLASGLSRAGTQFSLGGSRKSLKEAAVSCTSFEKMHFPLIPAGCRAPIKISDIDAIDDEAPFDEHLKEAAKLGIILDVRRAAVGMTKHVRVRPRFAPGWTAKVTFWNTQPDMIPEEQLRSLWEHAGNFVGLMDWRPSSKKPGQHGKYSVTLRKVKA